MKLSIYKRHIQEILDITKKNIIPTIQEALKQINDCPHEWHNWGERPLTVDREKKVKISFDVRGNEGKGQEHAIFNGLVLYLHGSDVVVIGTFYASQPLMADTTPEQLDNLKVEKVNGNFDQVAELIGVLRKFDPKVLLQSIEDDYLNH